MFFKLITLSGMLGSGKSTIAKELTKRLGFCYYATGNAQREIAQSRGLTTLELNRLAQTDPSIDKQIDSVFKTRSYKNEHYIVDSRLAFFFLPDSMKIKFNIDPKEAGRRVFHDQERTGEKKYETEAEATEALLERRHLERERFLKKYHVDIDNDENFDLVIDTTDKTPTEVCDRIISHFHLEKFDRSRQGKA